MAEQTLRGLRHNDATVLQALRNCAKAVGAPEVRISLYGMSNFPALPTSGEINGN